METLLRREWLIQGGHLSMVIYGLSISVLEEQIWGVLTCIPPVMV